MEKQKTLSQKEIDALLSILPTDGTTENPPDRFGHTARNYDFRSPDKFSKEQMRTLQMIHDNFARRVSSSLSAYLRTTVQVTCVHIEQGSFSDFVQNIMAPSPLGVLKLHPLPNRVMLALDTTTATVIIDRLLGGFGTSLSDTRDITDIEQSLMSHVMQYLADGLASAWSNVITLDVTIEEMSLNPEFVQVALPTDAAIFLGFEMRVREATGTVSICIPYSVLKPIISELSPTTWVAGESKENAIHQPALVSHLKKTNIDVAVLLGQLTVGFEDLLQLQLGDVLVLDTNINRPLPVMVGGTKRYEARPGLSGRYMAVQITGQIEE